MLNVGNRSALVLALLLAGALVAYLLPAPWRRTRRLFSAGVLVVAGWAAFSIAAITTNGPIVTSFGQAVSGVQLTLRADQTGLALVLLALMATFFALGAADRRPGEEAALLVTAAGAVLAALAGNAVMLFAGAEIASLGGLLLATAGRERVSRRAAAAFTIQHVFALGLLVAAVQLIVTTGTSDPYAVPPGRRAALGGAPLGNCRSWASARRGVVAGGRRRAVDKELARHRSGPLRRGHPAPARSGHRGRGGPGLHGGSRRLRHRRRSVGAVAAWRWKHGSRRARPGAAHRPSAATSRRRAGLPGGAGRFAAGGAARARPARVPAAWSGRPCPPPRPRAPPSRWLPRGASHRVWDRAMVLELGAVASLGRPYAPLLLALGLAAVIAAGGGGGRGAAGDRARRPPLREAAASPPSGDGVLSPLHEGSPAGRGGTASGACLGAPCCHGPMPPWPRCWGCRRRSFRGSWARGCWGPGGHRRARRHRRRHPARPGRALAGRLSQPGAPRRAARGR